MTLFIDWPVILLLIGYYLQNALLILGLVGSIYWLVGRLLQRANLQLYNKTKFVSAKEQSFGNFVDSLSTRNRFIFSAMIFLFMAPIFAYPFVLFGAFSHDRNPRRIDYLERITTTHVAARHPTSSEIHVSAHYAEKQGFYRAIATVTIAGSESKMHYRYSCTCPELSNTICFGCEVACHQES
jgi:hypothetical protein